MGPLRASRRSLFSTNTNPLGLKGGSQQGLYRTCELNNTMAAVALGSSSADLCALLGEAVDAMSTVGEEGGDDDDEGM